MWSWELRWVDIHNVPAEERWWWRRITISIFPCCLTPDISHNNNNNISNPSPATLPILVINQNTRNQLIFIFIKKLWAMLLFLLVNINCGRSQQCYFHLMLEWNEINVQWKDSKRINQFFVVDWNLIKRIMLLFDLIPFVFQVGCIFLDWLTQILPEVRRIFIEQFS